ncbi:MAG TPA: tetratricopeptide repeat protein [Candidatus Eisenbacteria bacterium]|nr:tetratricopeptide repeat protein [Candidatus Eisenbacteria bacterium]
MKTITRLAMFILAGGTLLCGARAFAQSSDAPPTLDPAKRQQEQQQQSQTPPQQTQPSGKPAEVTPLTLDSAPPPVNAEEEAAIKLFRDAPMTDIVKKEKTGEDFIAKYPQSRYRSEVYIWLVRGYLADGKVDKMEEAGDKELALNPDDPQTLAILGSTLPRAMNAQTPNPEQRLDKAEKYCQKALELLPTLPKPADLSDENFIKAKDQTSAMAYSGLGIVAFRRGRYAEAVPNFVQAVKLDPQPDPVNLYLLAISNEKTSHFDDAVAAFTKCAAIPGGMQNACKSGIDEAKKLGATQLSAPK